MAALSWDKWSKYKVMRSSKSLAAHLPETKRMNETALWNFLHKYGKVIVKPSAKSMGIGVIQISCENNGKYKVHKGTKSATCCGRSETYAYLKKRISRNYIVQRRIPLAHVDGRPFDLRVMVQRSKNTAWTITGMLAKVAGKGHIITNVARSRGKVLPVKTAIARSNMENKDSTSIIAQINHVAFLTAKRLQRSYPGLRTIGLDLGLDKKGKAWIIEANFSPSKSLFLKLKDKSMYQKIVSL